jgi:hypothetical protein
METFSAKFRINDRGRAIKKTLGIFWLGLRLKPASALALFGKDESTHPATDELIDPWSAIQ